MTSTTPAQDTTPAAPSTTSPSPAAAPQQPKSTSSKPKQRRKPVKRRGAKVEEEDEEHAGDVAHDKATAAVNEDASDSDSDFDAGGAPDDEEEEDDDDESEAEGAADPKTPGQGSTEQLPPPASSGDMKALLADGSALHPNWSEMPAVGESGAEDLPTLDFASLTPGALAAVAKPAAPSRQPSATGAGAAERSDKKAQLLAKREAKSAELKAKDPVAWEAQEQERKERDVLRKKEKNLRSKEKKREKKLAEQQQQQQGTSRPSATASTQDAPASAPSTSALPPRAAQKPTRPAVPSRPSRTAVQLGLANADASTSSSAAAQHPPPPHARAPPTGPASTRPPPHFNQGPSPDYIQAREAYSTRLANDPSYTPRVGKFWSHDDRLASPEVRPLVWRGRGGRGGERGGFVGRGRGRGRCGVRGAEGGHAVEGWVPEGGVEQEKTQEKGEEEKVEEGATEDKAEKSEGDDPEDDGWGRGEVKKQRNSSTPSAFASAPAWRHDGFEELQEAEARPASANGRGRGGFRGGRGGRGGWVGSTSHDANGRPIPGAVNPRYANLPFHPQHRFPLAPPTPAPVVDAPTPEDQTTSRSVAGEASLFDESAGEQSKPAVGVRLPGSVAAAAAPVEPAIKGTAALSLEEAAPEQVTAAVQTVEAPSAERPAESTGILYSANPNRLPSGEQGPPPPPLPAQLAYPPALQQQFHQLPPHLQPQGPSPPFPSQAAPQGQFIPRHASPAYYPTMHHQQQAYYSPDAFPSMPTPGATPPPPPLYPLGPPGAGGQAFFAPPRTSKIEIKAPGSGTILSASGDAFSPRPAPPFVPHHQQQQPQYSPISSRDGMTGTPGSPQTMHRQQQQHQQQMQMYGGGGYPSPYEYEHQQQHAHAVENGGIVYFVKPNPNGPPSHQQQQQARYQQQHPTHNPYYDPYAQHHQQQQQQHGGGPGAYGAGGQHQQDPAILMSSGGGYEPQQQHGGYGNPGEAAVYQHWG